eukprot:Selendium_serpulae@DN10271_c0_g1_i1.p1
MKLGDYKRHPNHQFFHVAVGDHDGIHVGKSILHHGTQYNSETGYTEKTLETMMKEMGVDYVDVVRMDTEGSEWNVLRDWDFSKIGQLLIEIHLWDADVRKMIGGIEAVANSPLVMFASEVNGWSAKLGYKDIGRVYQLGLMKPRNR